MYGLTIRWSLLGCAEGTDAALRSYVRDESMPRFAGRPGLHQKLWQMVDGGFFAGVYIWETADARTQFLTWFRANPSPVSKMVGHDPDAIQEWDVVGVVRGGAAAL